MTAAKHAHVGNEPRSVYVALLSNGWVKVGSSDNPGVRMQVLERFVKKRFGATVEQVVYFPACGGASVERIAVARIAEIHPPVSGTREFFGGIRFDVAQGVVREVIEEAAQRAMKDFERGGPADLLPGIIAKLKAMTPREIAAAAVACEASPVTLKNIRDERHGAFGPSYYLVINLHRHLSQVNDS